MFSCLSVLICADKSRCGLFLSCLFFFVIIYIGYPLGVRRRGGVFLKQVVVQINCRTRDSVKGDGSIDFADALYEWYL